MNARLPVIKVVGVSASGKSTLAAGLRQAGYDARPVSQEHSKVADLWKKFDFPQVLIYLDAGLEAQQTRRPDVSWNSVNYAEEAARLANARDHADLRIDTSQMSAQQVLAVVLAYLEKRGVRRAESPLSPLGNTGAPVKRAIKAAELLDF